MSSSVAPALEPLNVMIAALSIGAVWELERALASQLREEVTPAHRRVAELGPLAVLLTSDGRLLASARSPCRVIERKLYDEQRAPGSVASETLVSAYGSWLQACRAADGLKSDGRTTGPGKPWRSHSSPVQRRRYDNEALVRSVRACAASLLRRPTTTDYGGWCARRRQFIRGTGTDERLATLTTLTKRFGGWADVLAAAAITDDDLARWRARRVPEQRGAELPSSDPRRALAEADVRTLTELALDEAERARYIEAGFGTTELDRAVACAHALGGSLDWLALRTSSRGALVDPHARLDGQRVSELRRARGIAEGEVRRRLRMSLGPYRQLLSGRRQPTLDQAVVVASLLSVSLAELVT